MRAGYTALAVGVLAVVLLLLAVADRPPPGPASTAPTVEAALGLAAPEDPRLERRRATAVARATEACMARRGFSFRAVAEAPPPIPDPALDPVAWADRWGFGVSTSIGLVEPVPSERLPAEGLTESSRAARERQRHALYGEGSDGGCHGLATRSVYGARARALAPLQPALRALGTTIEEDPAMRPVRAAWRRCATAATADVRLPSPAIERETLPSRLLAAFAEQARTVADHADGLDRVQAAERRVAGAIARCEAAFVVGRAAVAAPHEARFVERHQAALAGARARIEAAEAALPSVP